MAFGKRINGPGQPGSGNERAARLYAFYARCLDLHGKSDHTQEERIQLSFSSAVFMYLRFHGQQDIRSFDSLPPSFLDQIEWCQRAFFSEGADADAALDRLDVMLAAPVRETKEIAARRKAQKDLVARLAEVESKIDVASLIRDSEGRDYFSMGGLEGHRRMLSWLQTIPPDPDLWHDIALGVDPDGAGELFEWIVNQPACDGSTAAYIFHDSIPEEYLEYADETRAHDKERFKALVAICRRWQNGDFRNRRFSFDEQKGCDRAGFEHFRDLVGRTKARLGNAPFEPSLEMYLPFRGQPTRSRYFFQGQMTKPKYLDWLRSRTA